MDRGTIPTCLRKTVRQALYLLQLGAGRLNGARAKCVTERWADGRAGPAGEYAETQRAVRVRRILNRTCAAPAGTVACRASRASAGSEVAVVKVDHETTLPGL